MVSLCTVDSVLVLDSLLVCTYILDGGCHRQCTQQDRYSVLYNLLILDCVLVQNNVIVLEIELILDSVPVLDKVLVQDSVPVLDKDLVQDSVPVL